MCHLASPLFTSPMGEEDDGMPPAKKPKEGENHRKTIAMKYGVTGHVQMYTHHN